MRLFNIPGVCGVCLVRMRPCLPFPSSPSPTTVVRSRRKSLVSSAGMDRRGEGSSTIMPPVGMYTSYTFSDLRGLAHLISLRSVIFVVWHTLYLYVQSSSWSGSPYFHTFNHLRGLVHLISIRSMIYAVVEPLIHSSSTHAGHCRSSGGQSAVDVKRWTDHPRNTSPPHTRERRRRTHTRKVGHAYVCRLTMVAPTPQWMGNPQSWKES
jgi:hypothetical protein